MRMENCGRMKKWEARGARSVISPRHVSRDEAPIWYRPIFNFFQRSAKPNLKQIRISTGATSVYRPEILKVIFSTLGAV